MSHPHLYLPPLSHTPPAAPRPVRSPFCNHNLYSQATNAAFDTFNRQSSQMISDMLAKRTLQCLQFAAYAAHEVGRSAQGLRFTNGKEDWH